MSSARSRRMASRLFGLLAFVFVGVVLIAGIRAQQGQAAESHCLQSISTGGDIQCEGTCNGGNCGELKRKIGQWTIVYCVCKTGDPDFPYYATEKCRSSVITTEDPYVVEGVVCSNHSCEPGCPEYPNFIPVGQKLCPCER